MSNVLLIAVGIAAGAIGALLFSRARRARGDRIRRQGADPLRRALDYAPVMIWTARPDTTVDYLNRTVAEFTGLPLERLRDEGWLDAIHPDDRDRLASIYLPAFENRSAFSAEYRIRGAAGGYRWVLASAVPKYGPDGSFTGFIGCDLDITERRDSEDRIREARAALEASHREIQTLAGRLIEAQDAERARIARDLHDDMSQQLAGLSIAFSGLKRRMDDAGVGADLVAELRALHQRASTLAQNVRNLSHDLHPTVLRHAGLVAALTSYCAEVERLHGTPVTCHAEGDFESIDPKVALCLYRTAQEALRNVVAHAGARRTDVRLRRGEGEVVLDIADDGRGFDLARSLADGHGLGLVSITERVKLLGGTLRVVTAPGQGTQVRAQVPAGSLAKNEPKPVAAAPVPLHEEPHPSTN